jgi:hypothetical protein
MLIRGGLSKQARRVSNHDAVANCLDIARLSLATPTPTIPRLKKYKNLQAEDASRSDRIEELSRRRRNVRSLFLAKSAQKCTYAYLTVALSSTSRDSRNRYDYPKAKRRDSNFAVS